MKKSLLSFLAVFPILGISAFAAPITLKLLGGGLSILDSIFLLGLALVVLGILLICIAFFKPAGKKQKAEEPVATPHFLDNPDWETDDDSLGESDLSEIEEYPEEDVDEPTEEEIFEEEIPEEAEQESEPEDISEEVPEEEIIEEEPEEEKIYPKLILTNRETNDFMIIPLSGENTIGRKPENDLVLNDTTVSGLHCTILNEEDKVFIRDENSTNGTYVNGERIAEKTELHPSDKISLGKQEFNISFHA